LFKRQQILGALFAATACGLQNAMATTYSGAVVRSSHLTGMFTDLGIGLGHVLRGMQVSSRRLMLSSIVISGFFSGGIIGAFLFRYLSYDALAVPAILTGTTGISYTVYRHWLIHRRQDDLNNS
jgi:uncharacterized membrane protein YoaK (UPF0700 family)